MSYSSINPYTGELVKSFETIPDSQLEEILDNTNKQFRSWRVSPLKTRIKLIYKLADELENNKETHARTITEEMGKPISQALAEVVKCADACRYYADNADEFLSPELVEDSGIQSYIYLEPQGIVFAIMPWNYPYWQVLRCLVPAVLSGNCVLLKHASNVPRCAQLIESAVEKSGFPDFLFENLFISHEQVASVIGSPYVRSVSLTGSNYAGETIGSIAGRNIKKTVLELGGSDPFIVFQDANLTKAADAAIFGRFQNVGQSCIAAKRLFVHDSILPAFLSLFTERIKMLSTGDPMDPQTFIGPLVNTEAVDLIDKQVQRSVEMGAEVIIGGRARMQGRCFYEPTVLINVPYDSPVAAEETFGPVAPVFSFNDYNDLIRRVNDTVFGLGSSVWTQDEDTIKKVTRDIDSGMVSVNGFHRSNRALPFGGVKESGFGRELSVYGIKEFVNIKTVTKF